MKKYIIGMIALLLLAAGCNEAPKSEAVSQTAAAPAAAELQPAESSEAASNTLAGTQLALAGGQQIEVLSVGKFDQQLSSLAGKVAIEGRVSESYPERGALILVDTANIAGCDVNCCPQAEVPVRIALEDYDGELPPADKQVVIVGDISVSETGYELAVSEIREGESVLLSRKA